MAVWAHWLVCCQCGWELRMEEVYGRPLPEYPRACPECGAEIIVFNLEGLND